MIAYLKGHVVYTTLESATIEVGGVGYDVHCPIGFLAELQDKRELATVWVYTHVREDILQLFGFASPADREFFLTLLKVSGIGPKVALGILSGARIQDLGQMIDGENVTALAKLPKVGKKTAEQMILTLKGKLPKLDSSPNASSSAAFARSKPQSTFEELRSALIHLGFGVEDIDWCLAELPKDVDLESGLRRSLRLLAGERDHGTNH